MYAAAIKFLAPYLMQIAAGFAIILIATSSYFYWKHGIVKGEHDRVVSECNESKEKFRIDAEHFKLARQEEVDKLNKEQSERMQNAIKVYIDHYDNQRNAATTSLRVKTNCATSAGGNSMPGTDQSRPKTQAGIERTGEAELPAGNLRQLNQVIADIEKLEWKCEQLLNSVP